MSTTQFNNKHFYHVKLTKNTNFKLSDNATLVNQHRQNLQKPKQMTMVGFPADKMETKHPNDEHEQSSKQ
jgi:hypothetical protein